MVLASLLVESLPVFLTQVVIWRDKSMTNADKTINETEIPDIGTEPRGELVPPNPKEHESDTSKEYKPDTINNDVQRYWKEFIFYLSKFPDYAGNFFNDYQKPITVVILIVSAIITLKVTLAAIDAINDIPLLSPLFELIGIGYSAWFVYRYLLRAATRQELSGEIKSLKNQVVGGSK